MEPLLPRARASVQARCEPLELLIPGNASATVWYGIRPQQLPVWVGRNGSVEKWSRYVAGPELVNPASKSPLKLGDYPFGA